MDPYVFMVHKGEEYRTTVIKKGGKHPIWNQTFDFEVDSSHDQIDFYVMDKDTFTKDDTIGFVTLTVEELLR